ncbi:hypothetical protein ACFQ1S_45665 [Kibdelosporangium lantanae]|uniref:Ammonium transporter AmtB-like domain-containing protein n=1 Tax=Kibdelosporangium lantanae TaxID=1497396 RepID=A0ABW3MP97_9PSEU
MITLVLGFLIKKTIGFRITKEQEVVGIDESLHAEGAYEFGGLGSGAGLGNSVKPTGAAPAALEETKA